MGFVSRRFANYPLALKIYRITKRFLVILFSVQLLYTILLIWMPVFTTPTIIGQWLGGKAIYKDWVSMDQISIAAQHAVIALGPAVPRPRIIGLSANAMAEDIQAALQAGMDDYLAKPITPTGLREMLEKWGTTTAS